MIIPTVKKVLNRFRLYYSPFFLCHYYIKLGIKQLLISYDIKGSLIDVGCGQKPYKGLFTKVKSYKGIDFKSFSINKDFDYYPPDYYFDKTYERDYKLPFKDSFFDNSVSFQVLEHHPVPSKLISELIRVTRVGGYIIISVPFLGGIHEVPRDFQRYTKFGLLKLFEGTSAEVLAINNCGSLMSTLVCLFNEYVNYLAARKGIFYLVALVLYPIDMVLQYASLLVDKVIVSDHIVFNYCLIARKTKA